MRTHEHEHRVPVGSDDLIAAWAGSTAITVADVRRREKALRDGEFASRLPVRRTPQGRNVLRWIVQLIATEQLIEAEARRRGLHPHHGHRPPPLDVGRALEMGGVLATVLASLPVASAVRDAVTADVRISPRTARSYYDANPDQFATRESRDIELIRAAGPSSGNGAVTHGASEIGAMSHGAIGNGAMSHGANEIGAMSHGANGNGAMSHGANEIGAMSHRAVGLTVLRGELPSGWERVVFGAALGVAVTVEDGQVITVRKIVPARTETFEAAAGRIAADLREHERDRRFADWVHIGHRELVHLAPGYEHPGDPHHPDAIHHH